MEKLLEEEETQMQSIGVKMSKLEAEERWISEVQEEMKNLNDEKVNQPQGSQGGSVGEKLSSGAQGKAAPLKVEKSLSKGMIPKPLADSKVH